LQRGVVTVCHNIVKYEREPSASHHLLVLQTVRKQSCLNAARASPSTHVKCHVNCAKDTPSHLPPCLPLNLPHPTLLRPETHSFTHFIHTAYTLGTHLRTARPSPWIGSSAPREASSMNLGIIFSGNCRYRQGNSKQHVRTGERAASAAQTQTAQHTRLQGLGSSFSSTGGA
jgi:hypothetical protein